MITLNEEKNGPGSKCRCDHNFPLNIISYYNIYYNLPINITSHYNIYYNLQINIASYLFNYNYSSRYNVSRFIE